ncbi:hypothetical protein D0C36_10705 [Mucilaginibacter conchicola]|uniref:UDP-N-acetylglucosamine kinase n=1 Tax=Mucilaginibacter conchicola TaxID=2303333 RepID=A0A372NSM7_9SPHI|nr:hypothetical protein [Mucilaginibacter conchicola]RFZ91911.1 hypothetical protein D0C36_10705 [Mucilaginibacter conchicola]
MAARQLYVFAGPNGAGKSQLSASMLPPGTPVFDGDKKFAELKAIFYDLDEARLWTSITDIHFPDWKEEMLKVKTDVAFETNFRDPGVMASVKQFTDAGFESRLIFMGLDSVEASIARVALRVAKGGHDVSVEYININFEKSLTHLYQFYSDFTSVHIYQNLRSAEDSINMVPLMTIRRGKITEIASELPVWVNNFKNTINNV